MLVGYLQLLAAPSKGHRANAIEDILITQSVGDNTQLRSLHNKRSYLPFKTS